MRRVDNFWNNLTEGERGTFVKEGQNKDFEAGQTLIRSSDEGLWTGVLLRGQVRVIVADGDRRNVIAVRQTGDIVGELSLIDGRPRSATIESVTRVRALVLTKDQLGIVTQRHPRVAKVLLAVVVDRLREADRRRAGYADTLTRQFAGLLLEYAERYGQTGAAGTHVPITTQADLASMIGTSRESLARIIRLFRETGTISTSRGLITVHDLAGLRAVALD